MIAGGGLLLVAGVGCSDDPPAPEPPRPEPAGPASSAPQSGASGPATPARTVGTPVGNASTSATPTAGPTPTARPSGAAIPRRLRLTGDRRSAMAFAPLADPTDVTVEGRVSGFQAWSTSKVLVVAAFLQTVADGDPETISNRNKKLITAALTASDADAVAAINDQIPGSPGRAMTGVLRSIGDRSTRAPDSYQGLMRWSIREQVRFMAALADGEVVSRRVSGYLLRAMRPIHAHAWGLGRIGATAYKGGWLRADTATRQLGIVDGYAVAIITTAGPAVRQTDGDSAHVQGINRLAALLSERLAFERAR